MLPHLGTGAGRGLEDVLLLVRLLTRPETQCSNVAACRPPAPAFGFSDMRLRFAQAVLDAYPATRRSRWKAVWDASYNAGAVYDHHGPHGATSEGIMRDLQDMWDPVWTYDLDGEHEVAVAVV